jgi:ABC-type polar amino acid transport system ATPase subunit
MNILGCLDTPSAGDYLFRGVNVSTLKRDELALLRRHFMGFVFQSFNLLPRVSALNNVELPLVYEGVRPQERRQRALAALAVVGLEDRASATPNQLSGGQQQRVAIARALAMQPQIMFFDEPTSALDPEMIGEVLDVMRTMAKEGMTMMVVSHEMGFIREAADRILFLADGLIVEDGTPDQIFNHSQHKRTIEFLGKIL